MRNNLRTRTLAAMFLAATVVASAPVTGFTAPVVAEAATTMDSAETIDIFQGVTANFSENSKNQKLYYKFYVKEDTMIDATITSDGNKVHSSFSIKKLTNRIYVNVKGEAHTESDNPKGYYYNLPASKDPYLLCIEGPYASDETVGVIATKVSDVSNHLKSAKSIKMGSLTSGQIYTEDDADCFKFNSGKFDLVKVSATSGHWASNDYAIYKDTTGSKASLVASFRYNSLGAETLSSGYIRLKKNTNYYVRVTRWNGDPREYSFKLKGAVDVPNSAKKAKVVKAGKLTKGLLEYKDDADYYQFKATKNGTVKLTCNAGSSYASDIEVYKKGSALKLVTTSVSINGTSAKFKVKKGKWYIVKVYGAANCTYSFKVK